jgi:hypothetical protein
MAPAARADPQTEKAVISVSKNRDQKECFMGITSFFYYNINQWGGGKPGV